MNDTNNDRPVLYFAYAGNMHPEQMLARCSQVEKVAIARLPNYTLGFFGQSEHWDGGQASAVREPGAELWGVVYRLSISAFDRLDAWQDARLDGSGLYFHCPAEAIGLHAQAYSAAMYRLYSSREPSMPSTEQLIFISEAARLQGLPENYSESIRHIPSVNARFAVPMETPRERFLASLPLAAACAC